METTLDQLAAALDAIEGRTPREVVDAFCPEGFTAAGLPLVPLTAGHELFLARIGHPLASKNPLAWDAHDVAIALFAFTRPSRDLLAMIHRGTFEDELHAFLDQVAVGEIERSTAALMNHWIRARSTTVAMVNPHSPGSKKKADSDGGYPS